MNLSGKRTPVLKVKEDFGGLSLASAVRRLYERGQTDYALEPMVACDPHGQPVGRINDGDSVIFCCRRGEREVELTEAFTEPNFNRFPRPDLSHLRFVILTLYHEKFKHLPVAFSPEKASGTLGQVVSQAGLRQLRVAESEKFSHVTFFMNMGENHPFENEQDICVPSPKGIPYEQVPQLSLEQVVNQVQLGLEQRFDLVVTNFANGDVIGHTANASAKLQCASAIDQALQTLVPAALRQDCTLVITADHGNLEVMLHPDGSPHVSHTQNPVPFIVIEPSAQSPLRLSNGNLADIAPTLLSLMGLPQPAEMTGKSLIQGRLTGRRRVLLIILDGWGIGQPDATNPIFLAPTPFWDQLLQQYPNTRLNASGEWVGLEPDKAGNSEAGHMNIGAGRIVLQDDMRLERAIADGTFDSNPIFLQTLQRVQQQQTSLHLIGLLSKNSSHGSIDYPLSLLRLASRHGLQNVFLHLIFDGRSTEPGSAPALLDELHHQVSAIGTGQIVTGVGRSLALDRNQDYGKIKRAFDAFVYGTGHAYHLK